MMRKTISILLIAIFLAAQTESRIDMIAHQEGGVEFCIPQDWEHEIKEDLLIVRDPESRIELFFLTSGIQVPEQVSDTLLEEISRVISHPEVASVSPQGEYNELIHYDVQGFGLYQGEIVDWEARFVAGARKSLMIIALGLGDLEESRQTVDHIYDTIQRSKLDPVEEPES